MPWAGMSGPFRAFCHTNLEILREIDSFRSAITLEKQEIRRRKVKKTADRRINMKISIKYCVE